MTTEHARPSLGVPDAADVRETQLHRAKRARLDAGDFWADDFSPKFTAEVEAASDAGDTQLWCEIPETYTWLVITQLERAGYIVKAETRAGKYGVLVNW